MIKLYRFDSIYSLDPTHIITHPTITPLQNHPRWVNIKYGHTRGGEGARGGARRGGGRRGGQREGKGQREKGSEGQRGVAGDRAALARNVPGGHAYPYVNPPFPRNTHTHTHHHRIQPRHTPRIRPSRRPLERTCSVRASASSRAQV